jgi:hypothetical protein
VASKGSLNFAACAQAEAIVWVSPLRAKYMAGDSTGAGSFGPRRLCAFIEDILVTDSLAKDTSPLKKSRTQR